MKIGIRAEGGEKIGMGHIMRTLVLAKELSKHNEVIYLCQDNEENIGGIERIKEEGFKTEIFKEDILPKLLELNLDLLITDSYEVTPEYFKETKKLVKHTGYIDDINLFNYDVDLIINQNANAEDMKYVQQHKLLGLTYLMLREEFRDLPRPHINREVRDIMITLGGADPKEFTKTIIEWVEDLQFKFHIVIGSSFKHREYFKSINKNNCVFYFNADMEKIMRKCDVTISAGGSTLYELLACGTPCFSIVVADNQVAASEKLSNIGLIKNLGWYDKLNKHRFIDSLLYLCNDYDLRREISEKGQYLIDGLGAKRISDYINLSFKI